MKKLLLTTLSRLTNTKTFLAVTGQLVSVFLLLNVLDVAQADVITQSIMGVVNIGILLGILNNEGMDTIAWGK